MVSWTDTCAGGQWSKHIVNGGHEVTRFLGVCPDLSWRNIEEGMDGLSGAEGIHTPNSHGYVVGQAWDAAREEREKDTLLSTWNLNNVFS